MDYDEIVLGIKTMRPTIERIDARGGSQSVWLGVLTGMIVCTMGMLVLLGMVVYRILLALEAMGVKVVAF